MADEPWTTGTVTARQEWDEGLWTFTIEADVPPFTAGQFVRLGLEVGEKRVRRAYSIGSAPGAPLEFYVTVVDDGALTPHLYDLDVGDTVEVERKAQGFFTLEYVRHGTQLWLLSTGTGIAPYISMLRTAEPWERFEKIVMVHGARHGRQLGYRAECEAWAEAHPEQFFYVPSVTREPELEGVLHGRLPALMESGALEEAAGLEITAADSHVMLCGNPEMVKACTQLSLDRGLTKNRTRKPGNLSYERYW